MEIGMKKPVFLISSGVFDILHTGHNRFFEQAYNNFNPKWFFVLINSDNSVKNLKGKTRPINNEKDRKYNLLQNKYINYVYIFDENTPSNVLAMYLQINKEILKKFNIIYVKSDEYRGKLLEAKVLRQYGVKIRYLSRNKKYSTTKLIDKIQKLK